MQNLLSKDQGIQIEKKAVSAKTPLWSQLGPVLLLGSFAVLLLKCAPLYWPLALTAFVGYATTLYLKNRGFYLSLFILSAVSIILIRTGVDVFWPSLLSATIALSWLLIFLGDKESLAMQQAQEDKILSLEENCRGLEKQLRVAKIAVSKESKDLILEKESLNAQLKQIQHSLEISDKEKEKLSEKCETLSQDIFAAQRKEIAFQRALEDSQTQLLKLKNQLVAEAPKVSNIVPLEDIDPQEKVSVELVQHQYANLREQFDEKSEALDQARKELFKVENQLLTLQKATEEKAHEVSEEDLSMVRDLKMMEEECRELEAQVVYLQEFITALLSPKKRVTRSKKSSNKLEDQEGLPDLLQEKINQISNI